MGSPWSLPPMVVISAHRVVRTLPGPEEGRALVYESGFQLGSDGGATADLQKHAASPGLSSSSVKWSLDLTSEFLFSFDI